MKSENTQAIFPPEAEDYEVIYKGLHILVEKGGTSRFETGDKTDD